MWVPCVHLCTLQTLLPFCRVAGSLNVGPEDTHGNCVVITASQQWGCSGPPVARPLTCPVGACVKRMGESCWEMLGVYQFLWMHGYRLHHFHFIFLRTTEPKSFIYKSRSIPVVTKQYVPCFTGKKQTIETQNKRECMWGVGEWNLHGVTRLE